MAPLAKLSAIALLIASGTIAAPWSPNIKPSTHRVRTVGPRSIKINSYHPESRFEAYGLAGVDHPHSKRAAKVSTSEAAKAFLESKVGIKKNELAHKGGHKSDAVAHEYFFQQLNGIPVGNAVANVAIKGDKIVSFGTSFVKPRSVASATPAFSKQEAIAEAESITGAKYDSSPVELEYFIKDTDHAVLTYTVPVRNNVTAEGYLVYVDAANGEAVNLVDYTAHASYLAIPYTSQDASDGFSVFNNPQIAAASPNGWHQYASTTTTSTSGNNVITLTNGAATSQSSATNNYNYPFDPALPRSQSANLNAASVDAFYFLNALHDLTYLYGFTETTYNFQQDNFGRGGAANDRVEVNIYDGAGGVMFTPADGRPAQMSISPIIALDHSVVSHEFMHGVSGRLTGGGTARCLQPSESFGLNEGWSEALPNWLQQSSAADQDFRVGEYAFGPNFRTYPYSTNKTTNPRMYSDAAGLSIPVMAELWGVVWHEIFVALTAARGFTPNKTDPRSTAGNVVALHLLIDGLSIQPCNPTFISARDAVIQADVNRYGGANRCILWKAFAKRGLGFGATATKVNSLTLPSGC